MQRAPPNSNVRPLQLQSLNATPTRTSMNYTDAFAKYGAVLTNPQWSVSAYSPDGSLVVCLWQNYLKPGTERGTLEYKDTLSKWLGNVPGCNEIRNHLHKVQAAALPIHLVIAHPVSAAEEDLVGKVADESGIKKTFSVKKEVVGTLAEYDGDTLRIVFRKAA